MIDKTTPTIKVSVLEKEYPSVGNNIIRGIISRPEFAKFEAYEGTCPLRFYDTIEFRRLLIEGIKEHKTRKLRRSQCIGYRHR